MKIKTLRIILLNTIKKTFSNKVWKFFGGSIGSISAVLLFVQKFLGSTLITSIKIGIFAFLLILIPRFILNLFANIFKHLHSVFRESKYGEAIILLNDAFSQIHWLRKTNYSEVDLMKVLIKLCNTLQEIFKNKNLGNYSVSIKIPTTSKMDANASLKNLCRDSEHKAKRETPNYLAVDHTVIGNTAFSKVLSRATRDSTKTKYYFNNDIPSTAEYENTSKEVYKDGILPYKSELVVPIMPLHFTDKDNWEILGFLCVDCDEKNKFDEKYDVAIIEGVADGIYDILLNMIEKGVKDAS